jgi:hypothetical protein
LKPNERVEGSFDDGHDNIRAWYLKMDLVCLTELRYLNEATCQEISHERFQNKNVVFLIVGHYSKHSLLPPFLFHTFYGSSTRLRQKRECSSWGVKNYVYFISKAGIYIFGPV